MLGMLGHLLTTTLLVFTNVKRGIIKLCLQVYWVAYSWLLDFSDCLLLTPETRT